MLISQFGSELVSVLQAAAACANLQLLELVAVSKLNMSSVWRYFNLVTQIRKTAACSACKANMLQLNSMIT